MHNKETQAVLISFNQFYYMTLVILCICYYMTLFKPVGLGPGSISAPDAAPSFPFPRIPGRQSIVTVGTRCHAEKEAWNQRGDDHHLAVLQMQCQHSMVGQVRMHVRY